MSGPTPAFWQAKFEAGQTPWDRGEANPQLLRWLNEGALGPAPGLRTLAVPGCGSGHDVAALARAGFSVTALDYAPAAVAATRERLSQQGMQADVHLADVLEWLPASPLDAVYEQTCLCALHPDHWVPYAAQLHRWLRPGGRLFALFMQAPRPGAREGRIEGPPYHCDVHAMRALFAGRQWHWPKPPFSQVPHPAGISELALLLTRL
jgi:methyl halide transferase